MRVGGASFMLMVVIPWAWALAPMPSIQACGVPGPCQRYGARSSTIVGLGVKAANTVGMSPRFTASVIREMTAITGAAAGATWASAALAMSDRATAIIGTARRMRASIGLRPLQQRLNGRACNTAQVS